MISTIKTLVTNGPNNPKTTMIGGSPLLIILGYQQFASMNPDLHLPWHDWFWYIGFALAILGWICPDWRKKLHIDDTADSYISKCELAEQDKTEITKE